MKFLLKTFLITFTLIQAVQAGRYYNSEDGRFISRDPLGYVDGMSLYNAYFAQWQGLDPLGTEVYDSAPDGHRFDDDTFLFDLMKPGDIFYDDFKDFFDTLIDLKSRDCPTLSFKYITGDSEGKQFAKDAKKKECAISLFMGHGIVSDTEYNQMKEIIRKNSLAKGCRGSRLGFVGCHAGEYNKKIPDDNRVPNLPTNTGTVLGSDARKQFLQTLKKLEDTFKEMCKCCNGKVDLVIYFGSISPSKNRKHKTHPKLKD